jgi:hypothetical protein
LKSTESQKINESKILVEKPERKRPLTRPRRRMEYYFKMDVKIRGKVVDCIYLSQDTDNEQVAAFTVIKLWVLYNVGNFLTSYGVTGFSRRNLLHGVTYQNT